MVGLFARNFHAFISVKESVRGGFNWAADGNRISLAALGKGSSPGDEGTAKRFRPATGDDACRSSLGHFPIARGPARLHPPQARTMATPPARTAGGRWSHAWMTAWSSGFSGRPWAAGCGGTAIGITPLVQHLVQPPTALVASAVLPKLRTTVRRIPALHKHKASGHSIVTLPGYAGPAIPASAIATKARAIARSAGQRSEGSPDSPPPPPASPRSWPAATGAGCQRSTPTTPGRSRP